MTVALIRDRNGTDAVEVAFSESAQFYKLSRKNPGFEKILRLLREALANGSVLRVRCTTLHGDVIEEIQMRESRASES
jgi:predicted Zn-dependent peptidase